MTAGSWRHPYCVMTETLVEPRTVPLPSVN